MTLNIKERTERLERRCKTCGKCMNSLDVRQLVCCRACGHKGRSKGKATYSCHVCGKQVDRYVRQQQRQKFVACSTACQKVIAGRAGKDLLKASLRAKKRWRKRRSTERRAANHWVRLCDSQLAKIKNSTQLEDAWEKRCNSAVVGLQRRAIAKPVSIREEECNSWKCSIQQQIVSSRQQKKQALLMPWDRKVLNAVSSLAKRRRNRFEKQTQHS